MFASVKSFENTMKSVAKRIVNSVRRTVENVKYNIGISPFPSIRNNNSLIAGNLSSISVGYVNAAKQVAQNVYHQQQISIDYAKVIENKGHKRLKKHLTY